MTNTDENAFKSASHEEHGATALMVMPVHDPSELVEKAMHTQKDVGEALASYTRKEDEVQKAHEHHLERAKARYESGNSAGGVISMRKVKRLEGQDSNLNQAVQLLALRKVALVRFIKKHKLEQQDCKLEHPLTPSECDDGFTVSLCDDILKSELVRIEKAAKNGPASISDEDLLKELELINALDEDEFDDDEDDGYFEDGMLDIDEILTRFKY